MSFKREGETVTLELAAEDVAMLRPIPGWGLLKAYAEGSMARVEMGVGRYEILLLGIGVEAGVEQGASNAAGYWKWIALANRLNAGNPEYEPYEIPAEFGTPQRRPS